MAKFKNVELLLILCILIPFELSLVFSTTNFRRSLVNENRRSVNFIDHHDNNFGAFRRVARSIDDEERRRTVAVNSNNKNMGGFKITARFTREQDEDDPDDHVDVGDDDDDNQMPTPDPSGGTWIGENYYGVN